VEDEWGHDLLVLEGHRETVRDVVIFQSGSMVASGSSDCTTRLWDTITGSQQFTFHEDSFVTRVAFSLDGKKVASGLSNGHINIRELVTGSNTELVMAGQVRAVAFVGGNSVLASVHDKRVQLWDVTSKEELRRFRIKPSGTGVFSADGKLLALVVRGSVDLWDVETGTYKGALCPNYVTGNFFDPIAFSADGKALIVVSREQVKVFDVSTGEQTGEINFHLHELDGWGAVEAAAIFGQTVAISFSYGMIALCQISSATVTRVLRQRGPCALKVEFSPDGSFVALASVDGTVRLVNTATQTNLTREQPKPSTAVKLRFLPGGKKLLVSKQKWDASPSFLCETWDVETGTVTQELETFARQSIETLRVSPDGKFVAVQPSHGADIQIWDSPLANQVANLKGASRFTFSDDGKLIALHGPPSLQVYCTLTWELKFTSKESSREPVKFSQDSRAVLWHSWKQVHWVNLEKGERQLSFPGPYGTQTGLSPNGDFLAYTVSAEESTHEALMVTVVNTTTGQTREIPTTGQSMDHWITFDSEGVYCAVSARGPNIWTLDVRKSNSMPCNIRAHGSTHQDSSKMYVEELAISTGGKLAALLRETMAPDFGNIWQIHLWDVQTRQEVGRIGLDYRIFNLAFSANADHLVSTNGRLPLPRAIISRPARSCSANTPDDAQDCLYVGKQWVVQGFRNIVFLPPSYLASSDSSGRHTSSMAVPEGIVAIGHESGMVSLFEFDLKNTYKVRNRKLT